MRKRLWFRWKENNGNSIADNRVEAISMDRQSSLCNITKYPGWPIVRTPLFDWIACNATKLFKDNWRQAEAGLMPLVQPTYWAQNKRQQTNKQKKPVTKR